jgi:hypothetical protein
MAKNKHTDDPDLHGGRLRVPRSRGALSGSLLIVLGVWGALIPLVGPYFDFGYTPKSGFDLTRARFILELLPGIAAAVGGLLLLVAANRIVASLGAWLAVAGGTWFIVGGTLDRLLHLGSIGAPLHKSKFGSTLETLLLFTGIGALILFLGAVAVGRLGVVSVRDVRAAQRREHGNTDVRPNDEQDTRHQPETVHTSPTPSPVRSDAPVDQGGFADDGSGQPR